MKNNWWYDKVAYQIYPKSFLDTNNDGVGDLRGVIQKLDYLKDLGIDIIWLSPIYLSPFADQGYDISDYYKIDPKFGTMQDMEELIKEAKKRNMYILMDLVVNHCSDEHKWFKEACKDPDGEYAKYFYIKDIKDNKFPTNWRSYFGGSVWDKLPGHTDKCYLHMFHKKQPDLNWENEKLREEIYKMVNWWMDKGIAGFRIDAIINIKKALPFVDYTPDRDDNLCSPNTMLKYANGIGEFLNELKERCFEPYSAFTVGEVFDAKEEQLKEFISENGYFSTMFDFSTALLGKSEDASWYNNKEVEAKDYIQALYKSQELVKDIGVFANIIENHDEPRGVSHYIKKSDLNDKSKKMLAMINIMLRGIPFIYQGQEIGMENMIFDSIEDIDDISTIDQYNLALHFGLSETEALKKVAEYSRDNSRTPMQWDSSENSGFSLAKPWLKVNPNYKEINVENNLKDINSLHSFYKKLISLRKSEEYKDSIVFGDFKRLDLKDENLLSFIRKGKKSRVLVLANYQNKEIDINLEYKIKNILINNYDELKLMDNKLHLSSYQALVLEI